MPSLKALARDVKNKKLPATSKKHSKKLSASTPFKSAEIIEEDDEDKSSTESASDDESPSSNPSATIPKANGKAEAPATISSSTGSDSESTDESGSEDEEGVESNDTSRNPSKELESVRHAAKESNIRTVTFKDTPQYEPPAGFVLASVDGHPKASRLFDKSSLEGKQTWYITAPASVRVASIENMTLQNAKEGKAIFSHNDSKFGIVQDTTEDKTYTKIIVPMTSNAGYRMSMKSLDQIFHIQQIVKIPTVYNSGTKHTGNSTSARATVPTKKPVRQQPTGLKMRFRPIGFGRGKTGNIGSSSSSAKGSSSTESASDDEQVEEPTQFRRPMVLEDDVSSTSSDHSESHDPSPSSDVRRSDAPIVSSKSTPKSKSDKSVTTKVTERKIPQDVDSSLKRKRSDDRDMKANKKNTEKSARKQGRPMFSVK